MSLRLAFWLAEGGLVSERVDVAIDGAQVQTRATVHFDLPGFLSNAGWAEEDPSGGWQGTYRRPGLPVVLNIHSSPGKGDVVAKLALGGTLRAECKKGPLSRSRSSQEYPLIREALGQLLTVTEVGEQDVLAVAVPHSDKFAELASRWRKAPLVERFGIRILTVDRTGNVHGFGERGAVEQADAVDGAGQTERRH